MSTIFSLNNWKAEFISTCLVILGIIYPLLLSCRIYFLFSLCCFHSAFLFWPLLYVTQAGRKYNREPCLPVCGRDAHTIWKSQMQPKLHFDRVQREELPAPPSPLLSLSLPRTPETVLQPFTKDHFSSGEWALGRCMCSHCWVYPKHSQMQASTYQQLTTCLHSSLLEY